MRRAPRRRFLVEELICRASYYLRKTRLNNVRVDDVLLAAAATTAGIRCLMNEGEEEAVNQTNEVRLADFLSMGRVGRLFKGTLVVKPPI